MIQAKTFKKKVLSSFIAACALSAVNPSSYAQQTNDPEEIIVTGVRAAQERAIDIKRKSAEVVDSISAEDIGKLPDATIADSLQRVTGVQIQRSAGQGGLVSIRGAREVLTTLNGELFLTAQNILNNQANYQDVPSSLISGSNVYKSMNAKQLEGGIGGAVDLLTRRSLKLENGFSGAVRVQAENGKLNTNIQPEVNGLIGFKDDDKWGSTLTFSYAKQNVSDNSLNTFAGARPFVAESNDFANGSWVVAGKDLNGDGDQNDQFINMWEWNGPEVRENDTERKRLGLTYNFNANVGEGLELNADMFYNNMDENASGNMIELGEGNEWNWGNYTKMLGIHSTKGVGSQGKTLKAGYYATGWESLMDGNFRTGVQSYLRNSTAFNNSIDLKYDNGGKFTGSVRYISSKAYQDTSSLWLVDKASNPGGDGGLAYNAEGDKKSVNPGAITNFYRTTFQVVDDKAYIDFDPAFVNAMKDPNAWYVMSSWLEGGRDSSKLDVLRADGNYKFGDSGITSIDFGMRRSERSAKKNVLAWFMDSGVDAIDPATGKTYNMLLKYHEPGYVADVNKAGTIGSYYVLDKNGQKVKVNTFEPMVNYKVELSDPKVKKYLRQVTDLGPAASHFNGSIPEIDASKITDHAGFLDEIYGSKHIARSRPDQSYVVTETKDSFYFSFNYEAEMAKDIRLTGNAGVRRIDETVNVTKHLTNGTLLAPDILAGADQNHTLYQDLGTKTEIVNHGYFLPNINANFAFGDEWKLKLSYDERTSLQPLDNLGKGASSGYSSNNTDPVTGAVFQRISGINTGGNPNLDSWKASVYNVAGEWYPTSSSLLGLTAFYMDIGGFVESLNIFDPTLPDSDGRVRSGANITSLVNGKNATIKGLEFSYQQSFDFLPGILSNTGMTFNYTYSPSTKDNQKFISTGEDIPFNSTAKNQSNIVLWYNDDRFEFRAAANYMSKRYNGELSNPDSVAGISNNDNLPDGFKGGLDQWAKPTLFVDLNSTYHINDKTDVSLNVSNLTNEGDSQYAHWENFTTSSYVFERRVSLGVSAKF